VSRWLAALLPFRVAAEPSHVVREERQVVVAGVTETWRIEFLGKPEPACFDLACPCTGFAFAELGHADLVRLRKGRELERMRLDPLFADNDIGYGPGSMLPRWPVVDEDWKAAAHDLEIPQERYAEIRKREPVRILELRDVDGDGRATEFLLQVATVPCGKRETLAIGLSSKRPNLHVFSTAEHPERPLVMERNSWEALLRHPNGAFNVEWRCGDHGSEAQTGFVVWRDGRGLHARDERFECDDTD